jgi:hypothetical protein
MSETGKGSALVRAVEGCFFIAAGTLAVFDGMRITRDLRESSTFDAIGPDRYVIGLGVLLLLAGFVYLAFGPRSQAQKLADDAPRGFGLPMWIALTALMLGYVGAIVLAGYALATALFFVVALRVMGAASWKRTLVPALVAAAVYWLLFARLADMSLPRGLLWPE